MTTTTISAPLANTYKVVNYKDAYDFIDKTKDILEKDEVFNTFPLWIANKNAAASSSQIPQSYAALFKNDQLVYIYICSDGNSYVGRCGRDHDDSEPVPLALTLAIKDAFSTGVPLTQVINVQGYSPTVDLFYNIRKTMIPVVTQHDTPSYHTWSHQITHKQQIRWTERTRSLDERAKIRLAEWADLPLLVKWSEGFVRECGMNDTGIWDLCVTEIKARTAYLWCVEDSLPRAMIWKRRVLRYGVSLAYVYTPDENRGKGYAAAMVARFTESLLEDQGFSYVTLLVAGDRDPHRNLYTSVGYRLLGSIYRFDY